MAFPAIARRLSMEPDLDMADQPDLPLTDTRNGAKRGVGRPSIPIEDIRATRLDIALNDEEMEIVRERAGRLGMGRATFVRGQLLAAAASPPPDAVLLREERGGRDHMVRIRFNAADFKTLIDLAGSKQAIPAYARMLLRRPEL